MKKTVILASTVVLLLGACVLPAVPNPNVGSTPNTRPTADVDATVDVILRTPFAETLAANSFLAADRPSPFIEGSPSRGRIGSPTDICTTRPELTSPRAAS